MVSVLLSIKINFLSLFEGLMAQWCNLLTLGLTYETYLNPLFRLQKKILRAIKFEPFSTPTSPIFHSLKILKLQDVVHKNILTFFSFL